MRKTIAVTAVLAVCVFLGAGCGQILGIGDVPNPVDGSATTGGGTQDGPNTGEGGMGSSSGTSSSSSSTSTSSSGTSSSSSSSTTSSSGTSSSTSSSSGTSSGDAGLPVCKFSYDATTFNNCVFAL
jgi:cellulose 1,4-beta-cellobiosidase